MIDRIEYAARICTGKKVVDIGGSRMDPKGNSSFDSRYQRIQKLSAAYHIVDRATTADFVMNLDSPSGLSEVLAGAEVVLCMETLEHLRNPGLVCDAICESGIEAYLTLPRTSWFYRHIERNGLFSFWRKCDHLYAFDAYHAKVFMRHNFPERAYTMHKCIGTYHPAWPLVWLATFGRGTSIGIHIQPKGQSLERI